jgi:hypothetical protein
MDLEKQAIEREINKLNLLIASSRWDFEQAVHKGLPMEYCKIIALEVAEYLRQRSLLQSGNFKELPYNVKMLL